MLDFEGATTTKPRKCVSLFLFLTSLFLFLFFDSEDEPDSFLGKRVKIYWVKYNKYYSGERL